MASHFTDSFARSLTIKLKSSMEIIRKRAYARAGLVGNPSDGYHGKTIGLIVRNFHATAVLYEWENIELIPSQEDHSRFDSIANLVDDVKLHGYYGGIRLVKATVKKFVEFCTRQRKKGEAGYKLHDRRFSIRYDTNIPRQVGLAGSSAIIVATLRALMEFYGVFIPQEVQPSLVLSVETDELGIAAGLQDRVIQIYEGLVYMDFAHESTREMCGYSCGLYRQLDPKLLPPLYIAYSTEFSEPTEALHTPLRTRYRQGDPTVVSGMEDVARFASESLKAIEHRNSTCLAQLMNENFEARRKMFTIDGKCCLPAQHVEMIDAARRAGASAKFAGSGGAIIGTYEKETDFDQLWQELKPLNCQVIKPLVI